MDYRDSLAKYEPLWDMFTSKEAYLSANYAFNITKCIVNPKDNLLLNTKVTKSISEM